MNYKYLSHSFAGKLPVYGGEAKVKITEIKSLAKGDSANVFSFTLENHWGTHVDAPAHFFQDGKKIADFSADEFIFKAPQVVPVFLEPGQMLELSGWEQGILKDTDIVIFKSGWSNCRAADKYHKENPGIDPEVPLFLRGKYSNVRAVGIDWISISSIQNRSKGRLSHKNFLNTGGKGHPILLIEDMDLNFDLSGLSEIIAVPLRVDNIDSAPCTVIGGFND